MPVTDCSAPPRYLCAGPLFEAALFGGGGEVMGCAVASMEHWAWHYAATDRIREPVLALDSISKFMSPQPSQKVWAPGVILFKIGLIKPKKFTPVYQI